MSTSYTKDMFNNLAVDGLDDELHQLAKDDMMLLEQLDVSDESERNLIFYLDHFLDELCVEFGVPIPSNRIAVIKAAFSDLKGRENIDLTDIRGAVYRAMGGKRMKKAYPNVAGVMEANIKPKHDVKKWIKTLGELHAAAHVGEGRENAWHRLTEDWDTTEKLDFQQWLRYYEKGDHEKYAAFSIYPPPNVPATPSTPVTQNLPTEVPKVKTRSSAENQKALISRLDAAKRLLRLFQPPVWPQDRWNSIYRALSDLEQEIVSLKTNASMCDRIVRTAKIWTKAGFQQGADILLKIAQPPEDDVASQIEKALTGREYENKQESETPVPDFSAMPIPPPPMEGENMPPPSSELSPPPQEEGMPGEASEQLPEPPPPPPVLEQETEKKPSKDENPYSGATTKDILGILEPLMRKFKEREIMRQLSKVDMMMDALNIVSYFPELAEAVGRLIETDSYVGNRIEKIIGKLKGGMREEKEKPEPPSVELAPPEEVSTEVSEKPSSPAPTKPAEETVVEVKETPTPGA